MGAVAQVSNAQQIEGIQFRRGGAAAAGCVGSDGLGRLVVQCALRRGSPSDLVASCSRCQSGGANSLSLTLGGRWGRSPVQPRSKYALRHLKGKSTIVPYETTS
jgi:hypothetical protein